MSPFTKTRQKSTLSKTIDRISSKSSSFRRLRDRTACEEVKEPKLNGLKIDRDSKYPVYGGFFKKEVIQLPQHIHPSQAYIYHVTEDGKAMEQYA